MRPAASAAMVLALGLIVGGLGAAIGARVDPSGGITHRPTPDTDRTGTSVMATKLRNLNTGFADLTKPVKAHLYRSLMLPPLVRVHEMYLVSPWGGSLQRRSDACPVDTELISGGYVASDDPEIVTASWAAPDQNAGNVRIEAPPTVATVEVVAVCEAR